MFTRRSEISRELFRMIEILTAQVLVKRGRRLPLIEEGSVYRFANEEVSNVLRLDFSRE